MHLDGEIFVCDSVVEFYAFGELVDSVEIEDFGGSATPPEPPYKAGWIFLHWTDGYTDVYTEKVVVVGVYQRIPGTQAVTWGPTLKPLEYVSDCKIVQKLDGECTMQFTTWLDLVNGIQIGMDVYVDQDLLFKVTKIQTAEVNGLILATVDCEHISFQLSDSIVHGWTYSGGIVGALEYVCNVGNLAFRNDVGSSLSTYTDVYFDFESDHSRRELLMNLCQNYDLEFDYDGPFICVKNMVGNDVEFDVFKSGFVVGMTVARDGEFSDNSYTIELAHKMNIGLGDLIDVKNFKFHNYDYRCRVVGIEWDPFDIGTCKLTVGRYAPTLQDIVNKDIETKDKEAASKNKQEQTTGKKVEYSGSSGGSGSGGSTGSGGWTIQSVDELPYTGSANVLYLVRG